MNEFTRRQMLKLLGGSALATALLPACSSQVRSGAFGVSTDRTATFLQLSSILTGQMLSDLDTDLALEYIDRLERRDPGVLDQVLTHFRQLVQQAGGDQKQLIELVDREIWRPDDCPTESYGGIALCGVNGTPECCMARDIPLLWYTGALMEKTSLQVPTAQFVYGSAASYLGALAWYTAGAHPQAQCGGTYGYWSTPPGESHPTGG